MKKRNRFLAILLTLAMVSSMLPTGALAADPAPRPQVEETAPTETPAIPTETPAAPVETPAAPAETPAAPAETPAAPVSLQSAAARDAKTPIPAAVDSSATWDGAAQEVANAVTVSGTTTITVTGDVTVKAPITVSSGSVTFEGSGKLVRDASFVGVMFDVTAGSLTLGAVTLDGMQRTASDSRLVNVSGTGTLNIQNGATLTKNSNHLGGGAVHVATGGTVNMTGGSITGNESQDAGGGVYVDGGIFNMTGGTITGNYSAGRGGGVYATTKANGKLNLSGTPKIFENFRKTGETQLRESVYLMDVDILNVSGNLEADARVELSVLNHMAADHTIGTCTASITGLDKIIGCDSGSLGLYEASIDTTNVKWKDSGVRYVLANAASGDGSILKPFATLQAAYTGLPTAGGEIRLFSDLTAAAATIFDTASKNVTLTSCKADGTAWAVPGDTRTVKRGAGFTTDSVLKVSNGTVTLDHITLDGNKGAVDATAPLVSVGAGTSLTLNDGATIQNNKNTTTSGLGGGVNVAGTLTMSSGSTITGNSLAGDGNTYGGGVYVASGAVFHMNGGTISNNTVTAGGGSGGGIMVAPAATTATVTISGDAKISGNSCGANGAAIHGGAAGSTITISGNATITGNQITGTGYVGGAVYPYSSTITAAGGVKITGNTNKAGTPSNLYLKDATTLKLSGALTGDANIGVYMQTPPTGAGTMKPVAVSNGTYAVKSADANFVHSDNGGAAIVQFKDGGSVGSDISDTLELKVLATDIWVRSDEDTETTNGAAKGNDSTGKGTVALPYESLGKAYAEVATGGTIHAMNDLTTGATTFAVNKTVNIVSSNWVTDAWKDSGTVHSIQSALTDNSGTYLLDITAGTVNLTNIIVDGGANWSSVNDTVLGRNTTNTGKHTNAAMIHVNSGAALTLNNGVEVKNHDNQVANTGGDKGGAIFVQGGTLTMNGTAKIINNAVSKSTIGDGGAVALWLSSTFTMNGGEISGNYAHRSGGGVRVDGSIMNLNGGTIKNNKSAGTGDAPGGAAIYCDNGYGVLNIAPYAAISITNNESPKAGGGIWTNSPLNILKNGSETISITGNKADGKASNVYLSGVVINDQHDDPGATIGISTNAVPTPGHPVKITNGTADNVKDDFTSDDLRKGGISYKNGSIYLDVAEKAVAQITDNLGSTVKGLYRTFDLAMAAITGDITNKALNNGTEGNYTVELLADCNITTTGLPNVNLTIQSDNAAATKYTLTAPSYVATAREKTTALKNIHLVGTSSQDGLLHAWGNVDIDGCTLQAWSPDTNVLNVAGTTTIADSNITGVILHNSSTNSLTINTGNVALNGKFLLNHADATIKLAAGSTAANRYNVELGTAALANRVIFDDASSGATIAAALAKNTSISLATPDPAHLWAAAASGNDVVLKEAQKYYVNSSAADDTAAGTVADPYKTIAGAYAAAVAADNNKAIHICVLSDLTSAALNMNSTNIDSLTIESYSGDNIKATAPWTITRKDAAGALLAITKGSVNLTNITLDGKGDTLASNTALVTVATGTALTLDDKATIQNNKNSTASGLGGGVNVTGTLTMNPGSTITGNSLTGGGSTYGGGVYVADTATFQMNGGTISNNSVISGDGSGGGIMVAPAATTATVRIGGDAQITGNSCGANGAAIHGGAAGSTITISGNAKMTGNKITAAAGYVGAAVYPHNGSLVLSDGVQITGNSNQNGKACNVYLGTGQTITIGGAHMGASSAVGVYCQTMPSTAGATVNIATNAVEADKPHFVSDRVSEAGIKFDGDKVVLAYDARYIPEPVYPGGPEPTRPDPNVTVEPGPGKVTTRPKNPDPGTKVTVTIEPETGWEIDKVIIVTVPGGEPVVVTGTNPITYIAPDPNTVKITVKYKRIPVDPKTSEVSKLLNSDDHIAYMVGGVDGKFDPTRGITRGETAQLFYNLLRNKNAAAAPGFTDVDSAAWYAPAVNALAELKVIEGRGGKYFDPMAHISRAEFTAIAMRFAKSAKGEVTFTDVPGDYWAESAISGAAQYGWIMGYEDGSFKPMEDITRAEAAKIVNTMLGRFPDEKFIDGATDLKTFPDVEKSNWAFYQIAEATNAHNFTKVKNAETWKK